VAANRAALAALTGHPASAFAFGAQVHGASVARVLESPGAGWERGTPAAPIEADGQASARPGVPLVVITADCLPVALMGTRAVASLHAGWRGLAGGIVQAGVGALRELGEDGPLQAAIGPGARVCCYEVGEEVHDRFAAQGGPIREGRRLDLPAFAARTLRGAGVTDVHDCRLCTICDPERFFSHRRDGPTGRQCGVVWRS
jgi:hypothetical protein